MTKTYTERINRLASTLASHELEAIVLLPGPNMFYVTGLSFHLMGRPTMAVITPDKDPILIVPELERVKAEASSIGARIFSYGEDLETRRAAFVHAAEAIGLGHRRVGVEPLRMRWLEEHLLEETAPGLRLASAEAVLEPLRLEKSGDEVQAIERAIVIAETALGETLPHVRAGMTELELASELTLQLLRAGSVGELPFQPIIASGPNAALPHAVPTARPLGRGDLLIVDWGAAFDGYISDLTRTFALESIEPEWKRIHAVVVDANTAGRAAAGPGVACQTVDAAARSVIEAAGYGPAFLHRTGHGIGMEAHEPPYIRSDNAAKLGPGMTFTVEPGIYLAGRGGVRVEDNVVITGEGARTLSTLPRPLQILPLG
jgi:Xaa-Pro dipeptidase